MFYDGGPTLQNLAICGSLASLLAVLAERVLMGHAPHPTSCAPSTGRARYNLTLAQGALQVARLQRVARLVQRVARLPNSHNSLKLSWKQLLYHLNAQ